MLICPKCNEVLIKQDKVWRCSQHHSYDIAKRGYVNLVLGNHKASGDDKEMVRSRTRFLSHGYYQPLCDRLIQILQKDRVHTIVDAGCGEGYYTNQIQKALADCTIYGFDLSKYAVDEACKAHTKVLYGVCNVFHLPLMDASCDVLLSVFAPLDPQEDKRVLKDDGILIKVAPGSKHLWQMKTILYPEVYENTLETSLDGFTMIHEELLEDTITIKDAQDIQALFQMTPYYWRTPKQQADALIQRKKLTTQIQFHITVFRKN